MFPFTINPYNACEHRLCGLREFTLVHTALLNLSQNLKTGLYESEVVPLFYHSAVTALSIGGRRDGEGSRRRRKRKE